MAGLLDELMGSISGGDGGLGSVLGGILGDDANDPKTEKAAGLGLEAIIGGLAKNTQDAGGAASLSEALKGHDGSVLDDLPGRLGSADAAKDGSKILGHVFGDDQQAVAQGLADKSGLDLASIAKLLPALAPVVMGMLGKKASGGGLDAGSLAGMLSTESGGFDLGDILGGATGGSSGSGAGGLGGILGKLKALLGSR